MTKYNPKGKRRIIIMKKLKKKIMIAVLAAVCTMSSRSITAYASEQ